MTYARPPVNAIQFQFGAGNTNISGIISAPSPLADGSFVSAVSTMSFVEVQSPLLDGSIVAYGSSQGYIQVDTPLSIPSVVSLIPTQAFVNAPTPLNPGSFVSRAHVALILSAPTPLDSGLFVARMNTSVVVDVPTPLSNPSILVRADVRVIANAPTPLANPAPLLQTDVRAIASAPTPLNPGLFTVQGQIVMLAKADSPLGGANIVGFHDFTTAIVGEYPSLYVVDLVDSTGSVTRVPISSWQATLQSGASNYVQCVIPAALDHVDAINNAVQFIISQRMVVPGLGAVEQVMAASTLDTTVFDQGPERYTCTISGYTDGFEVSEDPLAIYDRTLKDVRSISINQGKARVRCSIDWLLRPAQRVYVGDLNFIASYINYYVNLNDSYMDVGER